MLGVDYERGDVASSYAQHRALPAEVLANWREAVVPLLPDDTGLHVLDLGAGSGVFAAAWPTWCDCAVVAIEPARAMRAEMCRRVPRTVNCVGAEAQRLPLRDRSIDVAWLSAVIHHLDDRPRCIAELVRVLTPPGIVLVRGLFEDLGRPAGLEFFPNGSTALRAFPTVAQVADELGEHGLVVVATTEVEDDGPRTAGEAADRIRHLRHADSLLGQFDDADIIAGLRALGRRPATERLAPSTVGLLAAQRRAWRASE